MKKVIYLIATICMVAMFSACTSPKKAAQEDAKAMLEAIESGDSLAIKAVEKTVEDHQIKYSRDRQDFVDYLNTYNRAVGLQW